MDAFDSTNQPQEPVEGEPVCPVCSGVPGNPNCVCELDETSELCARCDISGESCACPVVQEDDMQLAAEIKRAALETPFKLGI